MKMYANDEYYFVELLKFLRSRRNNNGNLAADYAIYSFTWGHNSIYLYVRLFLFRIQFQNDADQRLLANTSANKTKLLVSLES